MSTSLSSKDRIRAIALVIAVALPLCAAGQARMTDANIAGALGSELAYSDLIAADGIDIDVNQGIVSLSGTVPTLAAYRQAEDIASVVKGVRGIVNRLEVESASVGRAQLKSGIEAALARNPATDTYQIDVITDDDGQVVLRGTVSSWAERSLADKVAATVWGVRDIANQLAVDDSRAYRASEQIRADIEERLRWDARVKASLIDILVRDGGRVTLSGTVGSLAEKRLAVELAHVAGVRELDAEHLEVADWANDEDLNLGDRAPVGDASIRTAITRALAYDPRILSEDIDLTAHAGHARLSGEVDNAHQYWRAEDIVSNTRGVESLDNELMIRGEKPRFGSSAYLSEPRRLPPTVLSGDDVLPDRVLHEAIASQLFWSPFVDDSTIDIDVEDGIVTLTGSVDSIDEYSAAEENAFEAGALVVRNDLEIRVRQGRRSASPGGSRQ